MKFELEPHNRNVPDDALIQDVVEAAGRLVRGTLTGQEYDACGKYSQTTLRRRFGSWFRVLRRAGLEDSCSRTGMSS